MIHNFIYDSYPVYRRIQPFEYLDKSLAEEYSFEYSRNILSDLSKFNAPIFAQRERRGIIFNDKTWFYQRDRRGITLNDYTVSFKRERRGISFEKDNIIIKKENNKEIVIDDTTIDITQSLLKRINISKTFNDVHLNNISTFDTFKILFGTKYCHTDFFQGFITVSQPIKKSYIADMYSGYKFIYGNIIKSYSMKKPDTRLKIYENIFGTLTKKTNIYKIYNAQLIKHLYMQNKEYFYSKVNHLYLQKEYFCNKVNYLDYYRFYRGMRKEIVLNKYDEIIIQKQFKILNDSKDILMKQSGVMGNIYQTIPTKKLSKKTIVNKYQDITKDIKLGDTFRMIKISKSDTTRKVYRFDILSCRKYKKTSMSLGLKVFKKQVKKFIKNTIFTGKKKNKTSYLYKYCFGNKDTKVSASNIKFMCIGWKNIKYAKINNTGKDFIKQGKNFTSNTIKRLRKDIKETITENNNKSSWRNNIYSVSEDKQELLFRESQIKFITGNTEKFIFRKSPIHLDINNTNKNVFRKVPNILIGNTEKIIFRETPNMFLNTKEIFTLKDRYSFVILNTIANHVYKNKKDFEVITLDRYTYNKPRNIIIENNNVSLERLVYHIRTGNTEKGLITLPYDVMLKENSIGFIVNKRNIQTIENLFGLNKTIRNAFIDSMNQSLSKNVKQMTWNDTELWLFKTPDFLWIDTHAIMLTSLVKNIMLQQGGLFLEKNNKNSIINLAVSAYKNKNNFYLTNDIFVNKYVKELCPLNKYLYLQKGQNLLNINKNYFISKHGNKSFIENTLSFSKSLNLRLFDNDFNIQKEILEIQVDKENIWYSIPKRGTIFKQYLLERQEYQSGYRQEFLYAEKELEMQLKDTIFIDKINYESNAIVQEFQQMQHTVKELEKSIVKTHNFVWVYEPDNPLEDTEHYKELDELLLPEKDIDYSTFEKHIFNKEKMRPTSPIEIINDTTFIAKYPIKHPTPNYEEVGIVYVDVPAELMHKIFCRYYDVWYANIFKFGNMSMVDSLRLMLQYMYSWIVLEYTGTEYLEPALRVFRQIRWFGEKSVMHNARYLISYERTNLTCNLHSGKLTEIKNDIETNNFFYINNELGVIVNNPTYFRQEVYINLYVNYPIETILKFNLSQAGGNTKIYLDSTYIDDVVNVTKRISIIMPPGKHTVKIIRPAQNNFATCYIGGITIVNGAYSNLQITYDPELKLGNLPLNDVAQKMIDLASLYDNEEEVFKMYREGNLAVGELYKELQRYWELHHQGKIKGKRLTIKET